MTEIIAVSVLCIAVAGVAAQWLAWRLRLPAIVLLFAVGLVVGPGLQILLPEQMFGNAVRPLVSLAVAIVVFEGGLALDFRELRAAGEGVLRLTVLALPISFVLAALAAHYLGHMGWGIALLFGAITVVTGPTVVLPLLRHTRLQRRAASFLKWEAILNDPVGALLAAVVLAVLVARDHGGLAFNLFAGLAVSVALGVGAGLAVRWLFSGDRAPEVLKTPILLAMALAVFATSNLIMDEAGLAASTIFGITLANLSIPGLRELARFKEALVVLLVSALFIVLTASLDRNLLTQFSWPVVLLTVAMIVLVRPAAIGLATLGSGLTWRERVLAGWIAPRGIVAAAVAGVASTQLSSAGYSGAEKVMPAVFALIAATMVLHGFSLGPVAAHLGLDLSGAVDRGEVEILWQPQGENLQDGLAYRLLDAVGRRKVKRLFFDGLGGFIESSVEPGRMSRFLSVLFNELRARGVTTLYSMETRDVIGPGIAADRKGARPGRKKPVAASVRKPSRQRRSGSPQPKSDETQKNTENAGES